MRRSWMRIALIGAAVLLGLAAPLVATATVGWMMSGQSVERTPVQTNEATTPPGAVRGGETASPGFSAAPPSSPAEVKTATELPAGPPKIEEGRTMAAPFAASTVAAPESPAAPPAPPVAPPAPGAAPAPPAPPAAPPAPPAPPESQPAPATPPEAQPAPATSPLP